MNNYIIPNIDNVRNNITIYIYSSPYIINIANYISKIMTSYGIDNSIYSTVVSDNHFNLINQDNNVFILLVGFQSFFNSAQKKKLINMKKKKYILYQLEQINTNIKYENNITPEIVKFMSGALYVLEYNINNFKKLDNNINKLFVGVPICKSELMISNKDKDIDILFYGNINKYRNSVLTNIIKSLHDKCNIKILETSFNSELINYISRSKLVLNIHYYRDAVLELCRIHEALPYNCKIISDITSNDENLYDDYKDFCSFVDFRDKDELINKINEELEIYPYINFNKIIESNFEKYNSNFYFFIKKLKYYNLFSKDLLDIKNSNFNYEMSYFDVNNNISNINLTLLNNMLDEIIEYNRDSIKVKKKYVDYIAHLHCYDLSKFDTIYSNYIVNISNYFKIIITYCIISKENIGYTLKNSYIILKIENRGMDIGGKFCAIDYLKNYNIEYKYILFLHSKTSHTRRKKYFSFISDKHFKESLQKMSEDYDGIFPNLILNGDWNAKKWFINKAYTEDLLEFLDCSIDSKIFVEGNCMILSQRVIKKIFIDNLFFYELLNNKNSFDVNWFSWYYKEIHTSLICNYEKYRQEKLYGNDLQHNYITTYSEKKNINISKLRNLDGYKLPDGMIEHAFERIYLNVIESFENGKYYLI